MKSIVFLFLISFTLISTNYGSINSDIATTIENEGLKTQAFEILKSKCNVCHEQKNKKRIFTITNIESYSQKIYNQVFKWKRMPKGKTVKLTNEEYDQLKSWLLSTNIKS